MSINKILGRQLDSYRNKACNAKDDKQREDALLEFNAVKDTITAMGFEVSHMASGYIVD